MLNKEDKISNEIKRIEKQNLLSDQVINNAIKSHASMFAEFLIEKYKLNHLELEPLGRALSVNPVEKYKFNNIDIADLTGAISESPEVRQQFRNWIKLLGTANDFSREFKGYLLRALFVANPKLLEEVFPGPIDEKLKEQIREAKIEFEKKLEEEKSAALKVWQEAIKSMLCPKPGLSGNFRAARV